MLNMKHLYISSILLILTISNNCFAFSSFKEGNGNINYLLEKIIESGTIDINRGRSPSTEKKHYFKIGSNGKIAQNILNPSNVGNLTQFVKGREDMDIFAFFKQENTEKKIDYISFVTKKPEKTIYTLKMKDNIHYSSISKCTPAQNGSTVKCTLVNKFVCDYMNNLKTVPFEKQIDFYNNCNNLSILSGSKKTFRNANNLIACKSLLLKSIPMSSNSRLKKLYQNHQDHLGRINKTIYSKEHSNETIQFEDLKIKAELCLLKPVDNKKRSRKIASEVPRSMPYHGE